MLIPQRDTADTTNWLFFWRKQRKIYSPSMLLGESLNGREHEVYMSSGRGLYWDTADDVSRKEARVFHWTMDSNLLRRVYPLSMGVEVTRLVVVTFIDDESLVYRDDYGQSYMWDKVTGNVSPGESAGR